MSRGPFDPDFEDLPDDLRVFPLTGALLLPGGRLPLNIFEQRYLAMVDDAMAGNRLIGMVQPAENRPGGAVPALYGTGCAGRIVSFSETDDRRYLITLAGLIRFGVGSELPSEGGFRRVSPRFDRFREDLMEDERPIERGSLLTALNDYFSATGIEGDWDAIEETPDERLVTSLAMICPFEPSEKQALLETLTLPERARMMTTILRMSAHNQAGEPARH